MAAMRVREMKLANDNGWDCYSSLHILLTWQTGESDHAKVNFLFFIFLVL